jgi:hypothetical protein
MNFIYKLPYEYYSKHRENMRWVLEDIRNIYYCEVCDKIIMRHIWSLRGGCDMICCLSECLDN